MAPDCRENAICSLEPSQIKLAFKLALAALDKTLDFIEANELDRPNRIDYINYLLGYFVFHPDTLTVEEKEYLIRWYKKTDFKNTSNSDRRAIFTALINHI